MVIVEHLGLPMIIWSGAELELIMRLNVSLLSNVLSLFMETSNETLVIPIGNSTLYGPEV